jgi:predicted methyltransferase
MTLCQCWLRHVGSVLAVGLFIATGPPSVAGAEPTAPIQAALAHSERSEADRARDKHRRPAEVLALVGVEPKMRVADLMSGSGWYTEVLARIVGPQGRIYAQNNRISAQVYGTALARRLEGSRLPQVVVLDRELENLGLPDGYLDAALMVQFYHDTYAMEVDRVAMNRGIFNSLKPGGVFCVVDHRAQRGSGARDAANLHRVDPEMVKQEVLAAGFVLEAASDVLSNPTDDHTLSVFDESIRGDTDRFILKFRRPR